MDMKKELNVKKRAIIYIVVCALLLVGFIGTFAYMTGKFDADNIKLQGKIDTANLSLVFDDDDEGINQMINLGESVTKKFTISNTGNADVIAKINFKNIINTYTEGSLTYSFSFSEDRTGEYTDIVSDINVPRSAIPITKTLASRLVIPVGKTYYYNLTITFNDLPDVNQDADVNAILSTVFSLDESSLDEIAEETIKVGMEYCLGEECFYLIDRDETGYTLMAKYNLFVGSIVENEVATLISETDARYGKQNELARADKTTIRYGTISYGDTSNYETSKVKPYIDSYVKYLNDSYNIGATGRMVITEDLEKLGCIVGGGTNGKHGCDYPEFAKYDWVLNTSFWTSTKGSAENSVYIVGGDGFLAEVSSITNATNRGIRPVIKLTSLKHVSSIPADYQDVGIFSQYYEKAYEKLKTLSSSEKVGQLLVASYTNTEAANTAIQNNYVGGILFFENAFTGKTIEQVKEMTGVLQAKSKIPLMMAVDEEGGRVDRVSSNTALVSEEMANYPNLFYTNTNNKNAWKLANTLYTESGNNFDLIKQEETIRNNLLKKLGLNMNFAPVVDIATPPAYISDRSFGSDASLVAEYAREVIKAGKNSGVSHSLKHFPGYGNNSDTHSDTAVDDTSMEELNNTHLVPFKAGINAGADTVLITHNIISALDKTLPASLSREVHNLLFNDLQFTGLAITDDLAMSAVGDKYEKQYLKAFQAGNHILLTSTSFATAHSELLTALDEGVITEAELNKRVFKVLAWKYYMGLLT